MTNHKVYKNPRQAIVLASELEKEAFVRPLARGAYNVGKGIVKGIGNTGASVGRGLKRTGGNLIDYGKKLVTNPIKTLKDNALTAGATVRDKEKQFDILENSLENFINKGKKVHFKALDDVDPNANIFKRGVQKLRHEGIATAGRRTKGTVSDEAKDAIMKKMKDKGLLHEHKGGGFSIHRDADVDELRKIYDEVQGLDVTGKAGLFDRARNTLNYVPLPGERGMLGLGIAGSALPQLANKETKDGRQRGLAERIGRAGLMTAAELAVAPIGIANRLYGGLGTGVEIGGTLGTEMLLNKNNKKSNQGFYAAPRGSRTRRHGRLLTSPETKPAMNVPGAPGSMQKQANRLTDAYDNIAKYLGANTGMVVHTMMKPIDTARGIVADVKDKNPEILPFVPGIVGGYAGLGYGGYKGGQKIKEKLKKRREEKEKTASVPKNPRARLRRIIK